MEAKVIKLIELRLKNFKGIKEFTLKADGKSLNVRGKNGSGKTTLFDAFVWLLFGKDSMNRSNFEIKTLDENGNVKQHGIDHEVEGIFELNGERFSLKRVYSEEWTKKRGSVKEVFTGHTTSYFIDGVPVKKKEYTEKVNSIISEDVFKLLTNPTYFNEQLNWKERRELLLEISGNVTDQEVAEASQNADIENLIANLNGRDIEDHKKIITMRMKEINKELDKIPIRIDEIHLSIPELKQDKAEILKQLENVEKDIALKREEINSIRSGSEINNKKKSLSDIELEIARIVNEHGHGKTEKIYQIKASLHESESNKKLLEHEIKLQENIISTNQSNIDLLEKEIANLRKEWVLESKLEFEYEETNTCPTCKQELPHEQVEQSRQKALESFNKQKAEKLESIQREAEQKKKNIEALKQTIEKAKDKIRTLNKEVEKYEGKSVKLKNELKELEASKEDISNNVEYIALMEQKEKIEHEIRNLEEATEGMVEQTEIAIESLENIKKRLQDELNKFEIADRAKKRMNELEEQEKELTKEYEALEHELYLIEEFTRTKVNLLENKINSKFKHARFKLFEEQINGGLKETCETTYMGIPYNSGLNNASRINIGMDIINTLNNHFKVYVPIFIDNAEAVLELEEVEAQTIGLSVYDTETLEVTVKDKRKTA